MDELSREYAAEHSGRLWKQLVLHDSSDTEGADASSGTIPFVRRANGLAVALVLGVGAGIAVKATELLTGEPELVFRNIAVLVLRSSPRGSPGGGGRRPARSSASPRRSPPSHSP